MLTSKDVSSSAHIGSELIHFVNPFDGELRNLLVAQIADNELVGLGFGVFVPLDVDAPDPKAFRLQSLHKVAADESTGASD